MKPEFPRIEKSIEFTLEYYGRGQIIEYMEAYTRMAKGQSSCSYKVDNWEDLLFTMHDKMEKEILQTVYCSNQNTQVIMFEELREWLDIDWRLKAEPNGNYFWNVVDEHNLKTNADLEQRLEIEVAKFRDTDEFKTLGENEEYEKEFFSMPILGLGGKTRIPYKEKRINRKYYCNELSGNFLDYYEVKKYKDLVVKIVGNFRYKIEKHLSLFDAGKYVPLQEIVTQKEILRLNPPDQKLIDATGQPQNKLELDISVPQLSCLILFLQELSVIKKLPNTEVARFFKAHFSTKGSPNISERTLAAQLSSVDTAAIDHWLDQVNKIRVILANMRHPK